MAEGGVANDKFDYKNIYPHSRNDFGSFNWSWLRGPYLTEYSAVCSDYNKRIEASNFTDFHKSCHVLCFYLKHINDKKRDHSDFNAGGSCKYFFYRLRDLMYKYGGSCKTTKSCYEQLRIKNLKTKRIDVPIICEKYVKDIEDISHDTFNKMMDLDKLYGHLEVLKSLSNASNNNTCQRAKVSIGICDEVLEGLKNDQNLSIREVLEEFKRDYDTHKKRFSGCYNRPKSTATPKRTMEVTETQITVEALRETGAEKQVTAEAPHEIEEETQIGAEIQAQIGEERETGIGTGMFVSSFASLIIMFILYKYTNYGSYLIRGIRKLWKLRRKQNNDHSNIIDSFDKTYRNLNNKRNGIAYSSMDYE
ncbi:variable surface protein [Plasmodium gonderi]|uniref:Variable surface protein n=1 Tax=Plasmodium gonderi TaxID=77519 RepID=A0A1Y1JG21_PLAGO|nr:variable surface protein [Plasmodium gonderi]GAW79034.1 variable surface protein [Plasmodium gonderi]